MRIFVAGFLSLADKVRDIYRGLDVEIPRLWSVEWDLSLLEHINHSWFLCCLRHRTVRSVRLRVIFNAVRREVSLIINRCRD